MGNAITFILEDLVEQRVPFKNGYIVIFKAVDTIHFFQSAFSKGVNFDGDRTRWSSGTPFYLSNFYFHTYIVLDDHVFDFSIRDGKVQRLPTYLRKSFLPPKGQTAKMSGFQPFFDDKSLIKKLSDPTLKMQVHRLDSVSRTKHPKGSSIDSRYHLGVPAFIGRPVDIFVSNGVVQVSELPKRQEKAIIKRAHSLNLLIESGHFSRKQYFSTETVCNQMFQN